MRACSSSRYSLGRSCSSSCAQLVAHERVQHDRPGPLAQRVARGSPPAPPARAAPPRRRPPRRRSPRARRAARPSSGSSSASTCSSSGSPGRAARPACAARATPNGQPPVAASAPPRRRRPSSATHSSRVNASSARADPVEPARRAAAAAPIATCRCGASGEHADDVERRPAGPAGRAARERLGVVEHDRERRGQPLGELGGQRARRGARAHGLRGRRPGAPRAGPRRPAPPPGSRRRCGRAAGPGRRRPAGSATHATAFRLRRRDGLERGRLAAAGRAGEHQRAAVERAPRAAGRAPGGPAASRGAQPARANPNPRRCSAVDLLELMARAPGAPAVLDALGARAGRVRRRRRGARRAARPRPARARRRRGGRRRARRPARRGPARRRRGGPRPLRHGDRALAGGDVRRRHRAHGDLRRTRARCPTCGPARASRRTSRGATSPSTRSPCGSPTAR